MYLHGTQGDGEDWRFPPLPLSFPPSSTLTKNFLIFQQKRKFFTLKNVQKKISK